MSAIRVKSPCESMTTHVHVLFDTTVIVRIMFEHLMQLLTSEPPELILVPYIRVCL